MNATSSGGGLLGGEDEVALVLAILSSTTTTALPAAISATARSILSNLVTCSHSKVLTFHIIEYNKCIRRMH